MFSLVTQEWRIDLFGILCMGSGVAIGYFLHWNNEQDRLRKAREARRRAERAYEERF